MKPNNVTNSFNPDISVVMSCLNSELTIARSIKSILDQSYPHFEFIIIDDGSRDNTSEIIKSFAEKDNRILFLQNNINKGLSYSLNRGIKKAKGEWIARMDADDFSDPDRLYQQYKYLEKNPHIDVLGSGMTRVSDNGDLIDQVSLYAYHKEIVKNIFDKPPIYHPTALIRKSVFEEHGYYNESIAWAEDADLWYRIYDRVTFHNLQIPLVVYTMKGRISQKIWINNIKIKWSHMVKRNQAIIGIPIIIRDFFSLALRMVKNF